MLQGDAWNGDAHCCHSPSLPPCSFNESRMLRHRDVIAILMTSWLIQLANQHEKTVKAALHLAFYTHAKLHDPFDVDGDGTVEALAIITGETSNRMLEILDLKPLHSRNPLASAHAQPFRPKTMLKAKFEGDADPLKITTGQIMLSHVPKRKPVLAKAKTDYSDRTRHYFCGNDWHDAAQKCQQPCPGGTPGECPGDEKCFADTPCDALANVETEQKNFHYQLTPAGGLPSVVTLWSDGKVVLHSVTSSVEGSKNLELKEMWTQSITLGLDVYDLLLLGDQDFSSGKDSQGQYGIVLVGGTSSSSSTIHALDALTGQILWSSNGEGVDASVDSKTQARRGHKSVARRRSRLLDAGHVLGVALPNCWTMFKQSLLNNLKAHWGNADSKWYAVHLDRYASKKKKNAKSHHKWHKRRQNRPLVGRPNSLVLRHEGGIQVRSLKNGQPLCHLSLSKQVLYSDLNRDGTLDQILAVTTSQHELEDNAAWITSLSKQIAPEAKFNKRERPQFSNQLCHLLVLSGMPAREQIFATTLCPKGTAADAGHLSAAPPLLMPTGEIVVALSDGQVSKHSSRTGERIWRKLGDRTSPTWHPSSEATLVTSLFADQASSPILIVGENMMSLLSSTEGKLLASTVFPQATLSRPLVQDWSGDGTPDVLIQTPDAVWGYRILLRSRGSYVRIQIGLLLVVMLMALLRNRFHDRNGGDKRSTEK